MKQIIKFFASAIVMLSFTVTIFAQASASTTATATAVIITPISITKTADLSFGNIAVSATNPGTVQLTPAGVRTATGGCTLPTVAGTVTVATFTVNGEGTSTYAITLPGSHTITRLTGAETMTVDAFASTPSGTGTLAAGTQTLSVGATLNVANAQVPGTYTNAAGFTVTVNYN